MFLIVWVHNPGSFPLLTPSMVVQNGSSCSAFQQCLSRRWIIHSHLFEGPWVDFEPSAPNMERLLTESSSSKSFKSKTYRRHFIYLFTEVWNIWLPCWANKSYSACCTYMLSIFIQNLIPSDFIILTCLLIRVFFSWACHEIYAIKRGPQQVLLHHMESIVLQSMRTWNADYHLNDV